MYYLETFKILLQSKVFIFEILHKLVLMPCPLTGPKMFWPGPDFCDRPKIYLHIVAVTNTLCLTKKLFAFSKIGFFAGTQYLEEALNEIKFLEWLKTFWDLYKDKALEFRNRTKNDF